MLLVAVATLLLADVLATVFFAITVAYLLSPVRAELADRGLSPWSASAVATATAFVVVLALALPLAAVVFLRFDAVTAFLAGLPPEIRVDVAGFSYVLTLADARASVLVVARRFARSFALAVPGLALKLSVFVMVLFAMLSRTTEVHRATLAVVPHGYRDVIRALGRRTRATLFAIYVLQVATATGTFFVALVVFAALGYEYVLTLAVVAAILQFLPVVGPSLLVAALALGHLATGHVVAAVVVFVVGNVAIAWLPDVVIRPRLARETAGLPGSLYFVGFVGGLLTFGTVGVIAGPLAVALVVEAGDLLSAELNDVPVAED